MAHNTVKYVAKAGSKDAGLEALEELAAKLLEIFPLDERANAIKAIATNTSKESFGDGTRLAAIKYANEINGIVTVTEDKTAQKAETQLPVIIVEALSPLSKAQRLVEMATVSSPPLLPDKT